MSSFVKLDWAELVVGDFVFILELLGSCSGLLCRSDYITYITGCSLPFISPGIESFCCATDCN
jgi:hypothetical protein